MIWPLLIGYARAKEFLLTGNKVAAPDAARMGLINYAVPRAELDQTVNKFSQQLASGARHEKYRLAALSSVHAS